MNPYDRAVQMLGLRQKSYQSIFAEGSPGHDVLADLAVFCRAFSNDDDNLDHSGLLKMQGRRQVYFRIIDHLKLSPGEIEAVYRRVLMDRARIAAPIQEGDE